MNFRFRTAIPDDVPKIARLYRRVAQVSTGLARRPEEVSESFVAHFVEKSIETGLIIVADHPESDFEIIAEIHAYKPAPAIFHHMLSNLTIAVDPEFQGRKLGRTIFTIFLEDVALNRRDIGRVELFTKETNARAISLYQSMGFRIEGRLEMRVRNSDGTYEADIPMGWQNPNFDFD